MATNARVSPKHSQGSAIRPARFAGLKLVKQKTSPAAEHLFVNNVRFLCMAAVVFMHAVSAVAPLSGRSPTGLFVWCMEQPAKFGTIGFFLISGFLMGEGLTRSSPREYFMRRMRRVLTPWTPWYLLCAAMMTITDVASGNALGHANIGTLRGGAVFVLKELYRAMFATAYWFVPNLLLALCVLLLFRRYLRDIRMGIALGAVSLAYGASLYVRWIPAKSHTQALLGFVFYLWLGAWGARNYDAIKAWSERIRMRTFVLVVVLAGLAALGESVLIANGNASTSTLRICNQVYSIAVVLTAFKFRKAIQPRAVNVRATTFGVYLSHSILLWLLMDGVRALLSKMTSAETFHASVATTAVLSLGAFVVVYGCSLGLTCGLIAVPGLSWLMGAEAGGRQARAGKSRQRDDRKTLIAGAVAGYAQESVQA
jgi:membrane-bound acyltransferase YfiQ involved in biofilm formation